MQKVLILSGLFFYYFCSLVTANDVDMASLLFLDISFGEIFIIIAVIFIIFGPQKIPEFARKAGRGIREIKKASSDIRREINQEINTYKTDLDLERIVKESEETSKNESETATPGKDEEKPPKTE